MEEPTKHKQYLTARKKHHVIYKTTCSVTGRYYIGMHSTDELEDGYLGSGKRLWQSIKKHGKEAHSYQILEHLPSREALRLRETELVNEELIGDPLCMNLALGGGNLWNTAQAPYVKVKQKDGVKKFWDSPAGTLLKERYSQSAGHAWTPKSREKASIAAVKRMARMKADGSWDKVVAKNKVTCSMRPGLTVEQRSKLSTSLLTSEKYKNRQMPVGFGETIAATLVGNSRRKKVWTLLDGEKEMLIENLEKWLRDNNAVLQGAYFVIQGDTKLIVKERYDKYVATQDARNAAKRERRKLNSRKDPS